MHGMLPKQGRDIHPLHNVTASSERPGMHLVVPPVDECDDIAKQAGTKGALSISPEIWSLPSRDISLRGEGEVRYEKTRWQRQPPCATRERTTSPPGLTSSLLPHLAGG